jgi:hypothetical protein
LKTGNQDEKNIVLVAYICALSFFASHASVEAPRQAAMETPSPLADAGIAMASNGSLRRHRIFWQSVTPVILPPS